MRAERNQRKKKKIITPSNILLAALIGLLLFSGYHIYDYFEDYWQSYLKSLEATEEANEGKEIDFDKLSKKYPDLIGWIYCKGTRIDYPVVISEDNSEYLNHGPDKNYNGAGSIFADYRTVFPFQDFITILYGHHMRDGSMFHCLEDFKKQDYVDKHNTMYIFTKNQNYRLKIYSVDVIKNRDDLYYLDYLYDDDKKENLLERLKTDSLVLSGETTDVNASYVTLSTCSYEFNSARAVVVCKVEKISDSDGILANEERKEAQKSKLEVFFMMIKDLLEENFGDLIS